MAGYSVAELDDVQAKWGLRFPPDLIERLRERRLLIDDPYCFDWVAADPELIRERLAWPFESYWHIVERHEIWWPERGVQPLSLADQKNSCVASSRTRRSLFCLCTFVISQMNRMKAVIRYSQSWRRTSFTTVPTSSLARTRTRWLAGPGKTVAADFGGQALRYGEDEGSIVRRQVGAAIARRKRDGL
jgi:hypothetical protein